MKPKALTNIHSSFSVSIGHQPNDKNKEKKNANNSTLVANKKSA